MKIINIGRSQKNDVVIDNSTVSRTHLQIICDDNKRYRIVDNNSTHGTFVNGKKVAEKFLMPGDVVEIGIPKQKLPWLSYFSGTFKPNKIEELPDKNKAEELPIPVKAPPFEPIPFVIDAPIYDMDADYFDEYEGLKFGIFQNLYSYEQMLRGDKSNKKASSFSNDLLSFLVTNYDKDFSLLITVIDTVVEGAKMIFCKMEDDMQQLENLRIKNMIESSSASELAAVEQRKKEVKICFNTIKNEILKLVKDVAELFNRNHPQLFETKYETARTTHNVWNKLERQYASLASTFYVGKKEYEFDLFDNKFTITKDDYVTILNEKNVIVHYNKNTKSQCLDFINAMITRGLATSPAGKFSISEIDADEMNGTSNILKSLNRTTFGIYCREDEITKQLESIHRHIENVIQNVLVNNIRTIGEFNYGKENPEGYRFLVIEAFPKGIDSRADSILKQIMKNGPRAGVNTFLLINTDIMDNPDVLYSYNKFNISDFEDNTLNYDFSGQAKDEPNLVIDCFTDEQLQHIVKYVNKGFETKSDDILPLIDYLLPEAEWWSRKSSHSMEIAFGLGQDMNVEHLCLSQEFGQNSAIIIGIPGSGKSVFLNTIITNSALYYSPDELELYLIDFSGVEFNIYAKYALPHAKVIAPESEREFGISILRRLRDIGREREMLCRNADVSNIVQYREKKPDAQMPRIVAIVDEFQKFFQTDDGKYEDSISKEAKDIITIIIREYRKYGINLILATQTLKGEPPIGLEMVANRVVFKCIPNDVYCLFGSNNPMGLITKTGECIYNSCSGDPVGNKKVQTFYAARSEQEKLLERLKSYADAQRKTANDTVVFRSEDIPVLKKEKQLKNIEEAKNADEINVWLGELIEMPDKNGVRDISAVLRKESSANLLIIGGEQEIAKTLAVNCGVSLINAHLNTAPKTEFYFFNFMRNSDKLYETPMRLYSNIPAFEPHFITDNSEEITEALKHIKESIDARKKDKSIAYDNIYLTFYDMQQVDALCKNGLKDSEAFTCLDYIIKNGSVVGVFVIMQIENVQRLKQIFGSDKPQYFNHRVVLQMTSEDSSKILADNNAKANASTLSINSRPHTKNRAYYFNPKDNIIKKFKPYKIYNPKN
jgi:hypothetical protein